MTIENSNTLNRILIIDDSKLFLTYISQVLKAEQYIEFRAISDPRLAIKEALEFLPEIILTDLEMPHHNGIELLRLFKEHPTLKAIPIIMLSSSDGEKNLVQAIENGAHDFLIKNLNPKLILTKIINLLKHKKIIDNETKIKQLQMLNDYITLSNHEFNNALFISNGTLRKLKKESTTDDNIKSINKIEEMNLRMSKLVEKLEKLKNIDIDNFDEEIKFLKIDY
jgi:PleD family two-component response regulator